MKRSIRLAHNMLCRQLIHSNQFLPMKYFMLLGGFIGFSIAMISGIQAGGEMWMVVLHASMSCVAGSFLFRLFRRVVANSVREVALQKSRQPTESGASS